MVFNAPFQQYYSYIVAVESWNTSLLNIFANMSNWT